MTESVASDAVTGKILNVNVGIMGHVDSGKTSLARALSTTLSTAALDKHPQSQERGITLDLGFSSFTIPLPEHLQAVCGSKYDTLQFTLVDCPGHASLIRTIIGGAQIIDLMLLVIDVAKGIQTQTAECLVVGEILMENMLVVLNKVDQFPADQREERLEKTRRGLQKARSPPVPPHRSVTLTLHPRRHPGLRRHQIQVPANGRCFRNRGQRRRTPIHRHGRPHRSARLPRARPAGFAPLPPRAPQRR